MSAAVLERELRLMIKSLTNLGYSDWASVTDEEVRTGAPRVYCSFLRFLLDAHPRVLQQLLSADKTITSSPTPSAPAASAATSRAGSRAGSQVPVHNTAHVASRCCGAAAASAGQGQGLHRSAINKYVATTVGFHPPPHAHCGAQAHTVPGFIVEADDSKFMQRLLQYVLPRFFAVAAPMTPLQFFRSTGGFVLAKAKLVRNVAALFARRDADLRRLGEERASFEARYQHDLDQRRRGAQLRLLNCGTGEEIAAQAAHAFLKPRALVDATNSQTQLTARQRAVIAEKQAKLGMQRELAQLQEERRQLNAVGRHALPIPAPDPEEAARLRARTAGGGGGIGGGIGGGGLATPLGVAGGPTIVYDQALEMRKPSSRPRSRAESEEELVEEPLLRI